jgi:hypothetical protein
MGAPHLMAHPPVPRDAIAAAIHVGTGEIPGRRVTTL